MYNDITMQAEKITVFNFLNSLHGVNITVHHHYNSLMTAESDPGTLMTRASHCPAQDYGK